MALNLARGLLCSTAQKGCLLVQPPAFSLQQIRTTVIVRRTKELGLTKEHKFPRIRQRNKIYEVVVNKNLEKAPPIKVILTEYVEGIGDRGDVVNVKAKIVRRQLFPANMAVYASPENLEELEREQRLSGAEKRPKMSPFTLKTIRRLRGMNLVVPMNAEIPWEINRSHIRIAFRKLGVEVPEEAIILPEEPVCEPSEFTVGVSVNNMEAIDVNTIIQPLYKDPEKNAQFVSPTIFSKPYKDR